MNKPKRNKNNKYDNNSCLNDLKTAEKSTISDNEPRENTVKKYSYKFKRNIVRRLRSGVSRCEENELVEMLYDGIGVR